MGLSLRDRKRIVNGCLPGFLYGTSPIINSLYNLYGWDPNQDYSETELPKQQQPANMRGVLDLNISPQKQQMNNQVPVTVGGITDTSGKWKKQMPKNPRQSNSSASGIAPWFALGSWAGGGLLDGLNSVVSLDELILNANTSSSSVDGVSYTIKDQIDKNKFMDKYDSDTATSFLTNPFRGLGRLFSRDDQKRELELAQAKISATNDLSFSDASTTSLQTKSKRRGYWLGKDAVETSNGFAYGIEPNARGDYGEIIKNMVTGAEHKIKSGKGKTDGALINIKPTDVILSERTGAADYYEDTGDLNGALTMNKIMRQLKEHGKLPGLKFGWPNAIIHGIEGLTALGGYLNARKQPVSTSNSFRPNKYQRYGLSGLAGLQYNNLPIINAITNMRASSDYALNNSGGLNGAQVYLGKIANTANMYKAIADLNTNLQERNIGLRANEFNTALNVGNQEASRETPAYQWDRNYYSLGHGAKTKSGSQALTDIFKIGQSWLHNENALNQYGETIDLYRQKLRMEEDEIKNRANRSITNTTPSTKYVYVPQSYTTNENWYSKYFPNLNFTIQNKPWRTLS